MIPEYTDRQVVTITYLNHRGEIAEREIVPYVFEFGSTDYYPSPQFLLEAWDIKKQAVRTFSMNNILNWRGNHATETQERVKLAATLSKAVSSLLPAGFAIARIVPTAG
jgi:predicted DNA-binding transcriptional regulator YafY